MAPTTFTVLAVDADESFQQFYQHHLESAGYRVLRTDNGRDAIHLMTQYAPDVVILGWMLRDWAGVDVLHSALHQTQRIPVIINTCYRQTEHDYFTLLADRFLMKSSDPDVLTQAVNECVPQHLHQEKQHHEVAFDNQLLVSNQ